MGLLERTREITLMPSGYTFEEALDASEVGEEIEYVAYEDYPTMTVTERTLLGKLADKLGALTGKGNA